ncbi:reverse transcriptase domain-containing protein [Tanacetum coccineum]
MCQPTMLGRGGPIAPMTMQATDFGLKNHMIQQVQQSCQYHGLPVDNAYKHIDKFLTVTQNMKQNGVSHDVLRLCLFPYSLTYHATAWFDRLPNNSIPSWEMVTKFLSKYFPPSMVTKLRNDISNFQQLLDESFFEAWERYKLSIDRCPNHNMLPVTQIDTFYNGLILRHRDTINVAAGAQRGESSRSITSSSPEIAALTQQIAKMNKKFLRMSQSNQQVNVVNPSCETYDGPHHYSECQAAGGFTQGDGALPCNTIPNPRKDVKVITTRSCMTLVRPSVPPPNPSSSSKEVERDSETTMDKEVERDPEMSMDHVHISSSGSTARVSSSMFKKLHFNISFAEALAQMPKYGKILKDLLTNKEKLLELANTPLNENCSAVLLKKLPEKLGDPGKFLIPCDFSELEECLALANLGASINLMPLSVWKKLMLPELIPTRMTLQLVNRSIAYPVGIAEDIFMQVGKFTFPADFVKSIHPLSGSPTLSSDLVVASLSPYLTPFEDSDFLLEETDTFLTLDDSIPPEIDNGIYDSEGYIIFLEKLLNDDPTKDLPPKELKNNETKTTKSPIEEPPELELKDLPPQHRVRFLAGWYFKVYYHNPIFDIQNEESDESETETIMEEVSVFACKIPYDREDYRACFQSFDTRSLSMHAAANDRYEVAEVAANDWYEVAEVVANDWYKVAGGRSASQWECATSLPDLFPPFEDPDRLIRRRNRGEPSLLFDFEEINMDPNNNQGPPPAGPIPQNPAPDLRTMEELCQPSMNG